jgi:hypothetical protein
LGLPKPSTRKLRRRTDLIKPCSRVLLDWRILSTFRLSLTFDVCEVPAPRHRTRRALSAYSDRLYPHAHLFTPPTRPIAFQLPNAPPNICRATSTRRKQSASYSAEDLEGGMENAYTKSPAEALKHFQVTEEKGLSEQQVASLRAKHGKNGMLCCGGTGPWSEGHQLMQGNSAARRPANTHLGAHPRAVQGPARHHLARFCCSIVCACPL